MELSCLYKEKEIHILGLYIDHTDKAFLDFLDQAEIKRNSRNQLMLAAFQKDGFPITMEDLVMENPDTVVTRAHFARALVKKGCVSSVDQAFKKYLDPDRPYYRKREIITPAEAIQAIRNAGGFPVLAHPCLYRLGWMQTEELVRNLKELGLGGMECWHSSNYGEQQALPDGRPVQPSSHRRLRLPRGGQARYPDRKRTGESPGPGGISGRPEACHVSWTVKARPKPGPPGPYSP